MTLSRFITVFSVIALGMMFIIPKQIFIFCAILSILNFIEANYKEKESYFYIGLIWLFNTILWLNISLNKFFYFFTLNPILWMMNMIMKTCSSLMRKTKSLV